MRRWGSSRKRERFSCRPWIPPISMPPTLAFGMPSVVSLSRGASEIWLSPTTRESQSRKIHSNSQAPLTSWHRLASSCCNDQPNEISGRNAAHRLRRLALVLTCGSLGEHYNWSICPRAALTYVLRHSKKICHEEGKDG